MVDELSPLKPLWNNKFRTCSLACWCCWCCCCNAAWNVNDGGKNGKLKLFVRLATCWKLATCCRDCSRAAECSWAFLRSSATLVFDNDEDDEVVVVAVAVVVAVDDWGETVFVIDDVGSLVKSSDDPNGFIGQQEQIFGNAVLKNRFS